MSDVDPDLEWDEQAGRDLHQLLHAHGIAAQLWWDRCPWGVRIPLTEDLTDEDAPSLYVQVETCRPSHDGGPLHLEWFGTIRLTDNLDLEPLGWTTLTWLQPAHRTHVVAGQVRALLRILRVHSPAPGPGGPQIEPADAGAHQLKVPRLPASSVCGRAACGQPGTHCVRPRTR